MREKHEVNIKKNSLVNFQIGLIAALAFVFVMFEVFTTSRTMKSSVDIPPIDDSRSTEVVYTIIPNDPIVKKVAKIVSKKRKSVFSSSNGVKEVDNAREIIDSKSVEILGVKDSVALVDSGKALKPVIKPKVSRNIPRYVGSVEFAPVFPGCERLKTNKARVACFQKKIQRLISRKFNSGLGEDLGLKGRQRIQVFFEIDINGQVRNIKARAPHPRLEAEAIRVAKKLPKMTPARQGSNPVAIHYALPIIFDVVSI